jgi:hypothetical protein
VRYYFFMLMLACLYFIAGCNESKSNRPAEIFSSDQSSPDDTISKSETQTEVFEKTILDTMLYDSLVLRLVHQLEDDKWPVKTPYPLPGAILPFNRIVAYYGNFYSKGMGILGALEPEKMKARLLEECALWAEADSITPVMPALHYLAITAQKSPGKDGTYRLRMPHHQIDKLVEMSSSISGISFLDIQVGHSTVQREIPTLEKYLMMPDVHLGLDPEWSMKGGEIPGKKIGTMDASDINYAVSYLSGLVKKHNLPPKILVVHRFTKGMITNYKNIKTSPEVQIVINMDGFGFPAKKVDSYRRFVAGEPIQFTGFKLFYKNDAWTAPHRLMTRKEILDLRPRPIYIQYQ